MKNLQQTVFIPIPKKGNAKECSNYCTIALMPHTNKVMLKILQFFINSEIPDVQAGFRKGRGTTDQIANIYLLDHQKSKRVQKKTSISTLLTMPKPLTADHNKVLKMLKEMGIPDHLTCLLRNL